MLFFLIINLILSLSNSLQIYTKQVITNSNQNLIIKYSNPAMLKEDVPPILFIHGSNAGSWIYEEHWFKYLNYFGFTTYSLNMRGSNESGNILNGTLKINNLVDDLTYVINKFDDIHIHNSSSIEILGMECKNKESSYNKPIIIAHSFGGIILTKLFENENINSMISGSIWLSPFPHTNDINYIFRFLFSDKLMKILVNIFTGKIKDKYDIQKLLFYDNEISIEDVKNYTDRFEKDSKFPIDMESLADNFPIESNIKYNNIPKLFIGSNDDILVDCTTVNETARLFNSTNIKMIDGPGHNMMLGKYYNIAANKIIDFIFNNY